ncbi:hypothetical protein [Nodosilinea nodulosa]|uniref:hypothetical protein n=1 Tax=Nodosilinea nodulosa TaxID=416001 RepID=UPI00030CC466|nr:hypothetical protein [Nodosilinea nodulosa]
MKIKSIDCPHCDERFEWFDPDVGSKDLSTLIGSLGGGWAAQALARGMGIALGGGWPGILLGVLLGGLLGRWFGRLFESDPMPCPRCCLQTHPPQPSPQTPQARAELRSVGCPGRVSGQVSG